MRATWIFWRSCEFCGTRQFTGSICPDHMPRHTDDPGQLQAFAFGYGYIKALIQVVNSEV